ncbi:MAG: hypothetical protein QM767_02590 [Anaeromyxobacter sp.]
MPKKTYEPAPEVPPELQERLGTMLSVMSGELSVSEGARKLGLSAEPLPDALAQGGSRGWWRE